MGRFKNPIKWIKKYLDHDKIQRLNFVVGSFNVEVKVKSSEKIDSQLCGAIT